MRPIRLEVQGLTAYHQPVSVDFSDLDLFAITGPTGAGKSSLVDALTYALFGQVPRVGRSVRELISQGEDRLKVSLEFSVNGDRYRIYRESGRKSQKPPQLERFDKSADEWRPEEVDRVRDTNAFIERLLRMDYEAFIRSVLLPQGEFQEFLAGDRDQRRRVLDGLLRLGVYADMGRAANAIAARQNDNAESIRRRLATELADATPEALKSAKKALGDLEGEAKEAAAARQALDAARRTAETLSAALERQKKASAAKTDAEKRLAKAEEASRTGEEKASKLTTQITDLETKLEKNAYDETDYLRYRDANNIAAELAKDEKAFAEQEKQLASLERQVKSADGEAEKAAKAHETAAKAAEAATAALDDAKRKYVAVGLRQRLKPGDICPVCQQTIGELPHEPQPELDAARAEEDRAKAKEQSARKAADEARRAADQVAARLESHSDTHKTAGKRIEERGQALADSLGGKALPAAEIAAALKRLEEARTERDRLQRELDGAKKSLSEVTQSMGGAKADLARLQGAAEAAERELKEATDSASESGAKLREEASQARWDDVLQALDEGRDAAPVIRRQQEAAQRRETELNQAIGTARNQIDVIGANIEKAKELREEEKQAREEATLAKDLATLLRADAFPTFIRESALQTLARDGSRRLLEISGGRYDFVVEGQDFLIEDRWNGGEQRSVKTLSGGETFLASLALALALAEQLPGLAGDSGAGALESLFIDEGFSNLDSETLDEVASALEMLGQDRSRLIGVITHVPALAERMPARITVHKTRAGSSVSVE